MHTLILHHHDPSPFAEKTRLIFGIKDLAWASVQIPMIMPKPNLTALTGGYRKTPVLQIGADIYCDSALIAGELEARYPSPSLFPSAEPNLVHALSYWSDRAFFEPGAGLSMGENPDIPKAVLDDRKAFFNFMDFDRMAEEMPHAYGQFQAQCQVLEDALQNRAQPYLAGATPGWIDILAYFPVWMANGNIPRAKELLRPFTAINAWTENMERIGRGSRTDIDAEAALDIAAASEPQSAGKVTEDPFHTFSRGQRVVVTPADYGTVPVEGTLSALDRRRVTIERVDDVLGRLAVHFPRANFRVEAG